MQKIQAIIRTTAYYALAALLVSSIPMTTLAEEVPAAPPVSAEAPVVAPEETYTYNPETSRWDSSKWQYDSDANAYQSRRPAPVAPVPASGEQSITEVGPSSDNTVNAETDRSTDTKIDTNAIIGNNLNATSTSGDALVNKNNTAGNAGSGNANADATIINTIHSTVQGDTSGIARFESDIYGNVYGDITLSPTINNATSSTSNTSTSNDNTTVDTNGQIVNNVKLNSTSGDANVTKNTSAGNATTGNADTVVNLVNLINSIIAANQSFIGTVNIHGNLNGDILISPEFIPQLLAHNGPDSNSNLSSTTGSSLTANLTDSQSIINNIKLNAESGQANVSRNTNAGSATTGNAETNLTVLNLTGRDVVAKNSLLVFVNVLGKWVGVIVNAPVGTTAAAIGNGVSRNSVSTDQTITSNGKNGITNNLDLSSRSGDANVVGNTNAGDARSGNATASANILNITTSSFAVSDWFGILFINVLGSWYGSFGINTANGDIVPLDGMSLPQPTSTDVPPAFAFGFVPRASSNNNASQSAAFFNSQQEEDSTGNNVSLANSSVLGTSDSRTSVQPTSTPETNIFTVNPTATAGFFITALGVGIEILRRRLSGN